MEGPLCREHELAFRTQHVGLKERTLAVGTRLPGTPRSLALRHAGRRPLHPAAPDARMADINGGTGNVSEVP